jgi:hypothetical protein
MYLQLYLSTCTIVLQLFMTITDLINYMYM